MSGRFGRGGGGKEDPKPLAGENLVHDVLQVTPKPLAVEQGSWIYARASAAASLVVKASAGRLRTMAGQSNNAGARYLMAFNATAVPANGTAPRWVLHADAVGSAADAPFREFGIEGDYFDTGIVLAWSTTDLTLTLATPADHNIQARYF